MSSPLWARCQSPDSMSHVSPAKPSPSLILTRHGVYQMSRRLWGKIDGFQGPWRQPAPAFPTPSILMGETGCFHHISYVGQSTRLPRKRRSCGVAPRSPKAGLWWGGRRPDVL